MSYISKHKLNTKYGEFINCYAVNVSEIEYVNIGNCSEKYKMPPNFELILNHN